MVSPLTPALVTATGSRRVASIRVICATQPSPGRAPYFKALYPNKTVWCYSGYTWEQLTGKEPCAARCEVTDELLQLLDVLVDGEFVQAKHDISLRFRGSSNQRLLDVPRTLAAGQPVWWEDEAVFATHTMDRN